MAKGFKHGGGGGTSLNFKVVGGTEQPENPGEHTIWVNTETDISGWVFSPEEPVEPAEGMVWINVGSDSPAPFNTLKKNGIYVYPISCVQYLSGTWENKIAYVHKEGTWVQFSSTRPDREYLIQDGVIDMTAHPHSATDGKAAVNSYDYNGYQSLRLVMDNGKVIEHVFSNVAVPAWANTMKIHYYLLPSYQYNPVFGIGGASVSITRSSDYAINEGTAQIDVTGIAGTTVAFTVKTKGRSGYEYCYIGNAWFE